MLDPNVFFTLLPMNKIPLDLSSAWKNANLAEYMTILGIYVHAVFLVFAVGFPIVVLAFEAIGTIKKDNDYIKLAKNASKIWGISFAAGAVTGTLVEFGLVVVWSGSIALIASMGAAPLIIELYAFIIEIVLIGTYLTTFDILKNHRIIHMLIGFGVLFGSNLSAYMILAVNAWMQVPWGTGNFVGQNILPWVPTMGPDVVNSKSLGILATALSNYGSVVLASPNAFQLLAPFTTDPWIAIVSPEAIITYIHNLLAAVIDTSFIAASYVSYKILKGYGKYEYNLKALKVTFGAGAIASILQPIAGDQQGRLLYEFQRNIFYATEGIGPNGGYNPILSFLLYGNFNHYFRGFNYLESLPGSNNPYAQMTIQASMTYEPWLHFFYYTMVILGVVLFILAIAYFGLYIKLIDRLVKAIFRRSTERFLIYGSFIGAISGVVASISGWGAREMGRHPWTIYGLVTYPEVITPHPITIWFTIIIMVIELAILFAGLWGFYMIYLKNLKKNTEVVE